MNFDAICDPSFNYEFELLDLKGSKKRKVAQQ